MQTIYQTMSDGLSVAVHQWSPKQKPKAVLHIVHGMAEHALRYSGFAEDACKKDFAVFAADHRGHGKTVSGKGTFQTATALGVLRMTKKKLTAKSRNCILTFLSS